MKVAVIRRSCYVAASSTSRYQTRYFYNKYPERPFAPFHVRLETMLWKVCLNLWVPGVWAVLISATKAGPTCRESSTVWPTPRTGDGEAV